jgi:hypothetical protein
LLVLKLLVPCLPIDLVAFALLAFACLPWLGEVFKSIKVGSVEVALRRFKSDTSRAVKEFRAYAHQQSQGAWWQSAVAEQWEGVFDPKEPYKALSDALLQIHYWLRKISPPAARRESATPEEALETIWSLPENRILHDEDGYVYLKSGIALLRRGLSIEGMTSDAVSPVLVYARNMLSYLDYLS